jgi:hypothetical protein
MSTPLNMHAARMALNRDRDPVDLRYEGATSCEAAARVKPRARLGEPWVRLVRWAELRSSGRSVAHGVSHGI